MSHQARVARRLRVGSAGQVGPPGGRFVPPAGVRPIRVSSEGTMPQETIRFATSADGTRLGWAEHGSGPRTLVWAANFITDIRNDWEMPGLANTLRFLGEHFRVIRLDHRGCGSSQRNVER